MSLCLDPCKGTPNADIIIYTSPNKYCTYGNFHENFITPIFFWPVLIIIAKRRYRYFGDLHSIGEKKNFPPNFSSIHGTPMYKSRYISHLNRMNPRDVTAALLTSSSTSLTCSNAASHHVKSIIWCQINLNQLTATCSSLLMALLSPDPQYAIAIVNIPALRSKGSWRNGNIIV